MNSRQRLATVDLNGNPALVTIALRRLHAAEPKPWGDKDPAPWGNGDEDGEGDTTHKYRPGEEINEPPNPNPEGDKLNLRSSFIAAASATAHDPEAARALLSIEARLGEISIFLPSARRSASQDTLMKLDIISLML